MTLPETEIIIEYDEVDRSYYAVWEAPPAIGLGRTRQEALEDLRAAVDFGVATCFGTKP